MNVELFIAKRIQFKQDKGKSVSSPAVRIAIAGIALGLAVMIVAVAIVVGFKKEVSRKVIGFGSHIQITNFDSNNSYETQPVSVNDTVLGEIRRISGVKHVDCFATKPGIMKTNEDFQGIVLKGVDENYDWTFFRQSLVEGDVLDIRPDSVSTQVIISRYLADKLKFKTGDSFVTYFVGENVRARKFTIAGIYQTNFSEYDKLFVLGDIKQVKRLNQWDNDLVSGMEIRIDDFDRLDQIVDEMYVALDARVDRLGNTYYIRSIKQLNPMIFSWLDLLDVNVVVILILMLAVAGFTMISGLLIIILERTNMIGILKSLGQDNTSIRKVFLYVSFFLISKGLFWGNMIALSICFLQKQFGFLKLNPVEYYLSAVPIDLNIWHILLLNVGTLFVSMLMLTGPSYIIARISPVVSMKFT